MKRTFYEYIMFFENESSVWGKIAKTMSEDNDFPSAESSSTVICDYMLNSPLYRNFQLECKLLKERYDKI